MTETISIPVSMLGESDVVLDEYRKLVRGGMAPGMATIIASRQFPGTMADRGRDHNLPAIDETPAGRWYAEKVKKEAEAAGIQVGANSRYNATMADHRGGGDPKAWVHAGEGASTFKRRIEEIGGACEDLGVKPDDSRIQERLVRNKARMMKRRGQHAAARERQKERLAKG
jgi:hypothetical protein